MNPAIQMIASVPADTNGPPIGLAAESPPASLVLALPPPPWTVTVLWLSEVVVGSANDKLMEQSSSKASTSPASFVASIGGHENPNSDASLVVVMVVVVRVVTPFVTITVVVLVAGALQLICLARSRRLPSSVEVVLGGSYVSPQSVPRISVSSSVFVTVIGTQLKPVGSSLGTSVIVFVLTTTSVVVCVDVTVFVSSGQAEQMSLDPQYAISLQHLLPQQVVPF